MINVNSEKQKIMITRISISFILFVALLISQHTGLIPEEYHRSLTMLAVYLVPYLIIGYDVVRDCIYGICRGEVLDESFLMTLATFGAFASGQYDEAVAVMLFYQVGEFFQEYAVEKSRGSIRQLMSIAPEYANLENEDGSVEVIDPENIKIGDILIIKPGEKVPIDGIVIEGEGVLNTSALTGESMPCFVEEGDNIVSGCINGDKLIKIQADREYDDSTVSRILELVETASSKKSKTEKFITRFSRYYTPVVVVAALMVAFIPPIFVGDLMKWILRGCTFLVISCPCALVLSVPMAFFGGIGAASKLGMLVKGGNYLEAMAHVDTVAFDKTGTLTEGNFEVRMVDAVDGYSTEEVIRYAAAAESGSTHPLASSIIEACKKPFSESKISNIENIKGRGIVAKVGRDWIVAGSQRLMEEKNISIDSFESKEKGVTVYVAKNDKLIGSIVLADSPKKNSEKALKSLLAEGVKHTVMMTGDAKKNAEITANELGLTEYKADLLPQDKVGAIEEIIEEVNLSSKEKNKKVVFVGDGINDAPVLSRADVGIALGSMGSDAAIEAADIVIMDDDLTKISDLIRIARKTVGISKANIVFALSFKTAILILGAFGMANMWMAVIADVGVAVVCILNSMRMLTFK